MKYIRQRQKSKGGLAVLISDKLEIKTKITVIKKWYSRALPTIRASQIASTTRGQTAEARKTTILQPVEQKPHSQKDRQDEKAEGYIPDEGKR